MSILVDRNTRVLCQGITGRAGQFHAKHCREYGTQLVGGVTPGRGGQTIDGVPVFDTVAEAVEQTGADATMIFVPPAFAADAILEAADAGVRLIVAITEGIPVLDMVRAMEAVRRSGSRLIGPNCPGIITPGSARSASCPATSTGPDRSRDQPLGHAHLRSRVATDPRRTRAIHVRGPGGRSDRGTSFVDVLGMFENDPATEGILMIGEIGGSAEEQAAAFIAGHVRKPVAAFIAGRTAPPGKRMGHAGAIVSGGKGTRPTRSPRSRPPVSASSTARPKWASPCRR